MRQIQFWPGHSESAKSGAYKMVFGKATFDAMQPSRQQQQVFKKPKRFRSAFTTEQINYLEKQFKRFPYINREQRKEVASILKIEERPIKIWFQNRRMREKKESHKEFDDETHKAQEFGKYQLHNVPVEPSTNDQRSYSLPMLSPIVDATAKANNDIKKSNTVEHKMKPKLAQPNKFKKLNAEPKPVSSIANYYKEADNEHVSPYFQHSPPARSILPFTMNIKNTPLPPQESQRIKTSAEFSINLCKKYKQQSVTSTPSIYNKVAYQGEKANTLDTRDAPSNKKPAIATKSHRPSEDLSGNKKPILSQPPPPKPQKQETLNNPTYYPVMPTIYAPPFMASGGVLWKPVNVMPIMATNGPPVAVPSSQGTAQVQSKDCKCNCHANCTTQHAPMTLPPCLQSPYAQYNMYCTLPPYQSQF